MKYSHAHFKVLGVTQLLFLNAIHDEVIVIDIMVYIAAVNKKANYVSLNILYYIIHALYNILYINIVSYFDWVKSSQVTFIYIAPLTIQIVTKHCTISK